MPRNNKQPAGKGVSNEGLKPVMSIFKLVWRNYKLSFCLVIVGILVSAWASLQSTLFTQTLIDDYITPMLASGSTDYGPLAGAIGRLAVVAVLGIAAAYLYNRLMVIISQGTLRDLRVDVFSHMETLPISYFDTHGHGDIMSVYTNDIDTLRQLISQTIPQFVNSSVTIAMTFVSMVVLSVPLTLMTLAMVALVLMAAGRIGGARASTLPTSSSAWATSTPSSRRPCRARRWSRSSATRSAPSRTSMRATMPCATRPCRPTASPTS